MPLSENNCAIRFHASIPLKKHVAPLQVRRDRRAQAEPDVQSGLTVVHAPLNLAHTRVSTHKKEEGSTGIKGSVHPYAK